MPFPLFRTRVIEANRAIDHLIAIAGNLTNSRMTIDACMPFHWRDRFPAVNPPSAEMVAEARCRYLYLLE